MRMISDCMSCMGVSGWYMAAKLRWAHGLLTAGVLERVWLIRYSRHLAEVWKRWGEEAHWRRNCLHAAQAHLLSLPLDPCKDLPA